METSTHTGYPKDYTASVNPLSRVQRRNTVSADWEMHSERMEERCKNSSCCIISAGLVSGTVAVGTVIIAAFTLA